jgi:hypothetical protein
VETATGSPGDLPVGSGCVRAAGIVGREHSVHLWLAHVKETHIKLEVAASTGLGHVGAERGLLGREGRRPIAECLGTAGLLNSSA